MNMNKDNLYYNIVKFDLLIGSSHGSYPDPSPDPDRSPSPLI